MLKTDVMDAMEVVFNNAAANGEVIRIDKLTVDLGTIPAGNLETVFKARLVEELSKAIPGIKHTAKPADNTIVLSRRQSLIGAFKYFLLNGRLPWYSVAKQMREWESEITAAIGTSEWQELLIWLRESSKENPAIIERLIRQFSDSFISSFLGSAIEAGESGSPDSVYNDLSVFLSTIMPETADTIRYIVWKSYLNLILDAGSKQPGLRTILSVTTGNIAWTPAAMDILAKTNWANTVSGTMAEAVKELKKQHNAVKKTSEPTHIQNTRRKDIDKDEQPISAVKGKNAENIEAAKKAEYSPGTKKRAAELKKDNVVSNESRDEGSLSGRNCGIVLLNPFLPQYFKELGLLDANAFVNEEQQKRAVLLLHFVATGNNEAPEFDLTLQKILCGLPLSEPVPAVIELTEQEITESENLLKAITQHWKPLNNTSVLGLRTSFLLRDGELRATDTGWKLQVETQTIDILIGKLPWGYSTIRLPWMDKILSVEWY